MSNDEIDTVWEHATRIGTFALLVFAITSFVSNIILPFVIAPSYTDPSASTKAASSAISSDTKQSASSSLTTNYLSKLVIPGLTLSRAWQLSHILFAVAMFLTFFVTTPTAGTVLVGIVGISWALTLWAPFGLISAEISQRDALRRRLHHQQQQQEGYLPSPAQPPRRRQHPDLVPNEESGSGGGGGGGGDDDQAGIILGLHNVSIAAPQVIATLASSLIFRWLQQPRGTAGDDSVGWVLRISALTTLLAAWWTSKLKEEKPVAAVAMVDDGDDDTTENMIR